MTQFFNQWLYCLKHYAYMCLFSSGPDRLPYRLDYLFITLFAYCLLGLTLVNDKQDYSLVLLQIALETGLLALISYLGLKWVKKLPRFKQCLSALVGINFVISAISIPMINWLVSEGPVEDGVDRKLMYLTLFVIFWNLAVMSQILKRTFEVSITMSAMIAFRS